MEARLPQAGDVTVKIKDILNANPAWVRRTWPRADLLRQSLAQEGLHVPVLLNRDYEVIDGARRVQCADELGWKVIPAIVTDEWPVVEAYFKHIRVLDEKDWPAAPMRWLEYDDLIRRFLRPIFTPYSRAMGLERRSKGLGADSELERTSGSRIHSVLPDMLGHRRAMWVGVNDLGAALNKARKEHGNAFADDLLAMANRIEETTGQLHLASFKTREAIHNRQLPKVKADEKTAAVQVEKIDRLLGVLRAVALEASSIGEINPALELADGSRLAQELRLQTRRIYPLRKALEVHVARLKKETEK